MKPIFSISGISESAQKRVLSISITDELGVKSDKAQVRFDDGDYSIETPTQGKVFTVMLGYDEKGPPLTPLGTFQLDEIKFMESQAAILEMSGNAQHHEKNSTKAPTTTSWDEKTLGALFSDIASKNGYAPEIDGEIGGIYYDHLDQNDESDISFATRIADKHDAFVKIQDGKMIVKPRNKAVGQVTVKKLANGQASVNGNVVTVAINVSATKNSRNKYKKVIAYWQDVDKSKRTGENAGEGTPVFKMKETFETKDKAKAAAAAKLNKLNRGTGKLDSLTLPGHPEIRAGKKLILEGFRPDICGEWKIASASHKLDNGGYQTTVKADRDEA